MVRMRVTVEVTPGDGPAFTRELTDAETLEFVARLLDLRAEPPPAKVFGPVSLLERAYLELLADGATLRVSSKEARFYRDGKTVPAGFHLRSKMTIPQLIARGWIAEAPSKFRTCKIYTITEQGREALER